MSKQKQDLKQIFIGLQEQMIAELTTYKRSISHPGAKGNACELNWIEWLSKYLPKRYKVDKAKIIDSKGDFSHEIDVVVYGQQYSPFVFNQNNTIYIPAESVYAVFEVKPELNKYTIEYAAEKAESVRQLCRTIASIKTIDGVKRPEKNTVILSGILTLSSKWKEPLGESFEKYVAQLNKIQRLNFGCVLKGGSFRIEYENEESDISKIEKSTPEESLIFFFLKFIAELQKIGTVSPLDISEYAKVLDSF